MPLLPPPATCTCQAGTHTHDKPTCLCSHIREVCTHVLCLRLRSHTRVPSCVTCVCTPAHHTHGHAPVFIFVGVHTDTGVVRVCMHGLFARTHTHQHTHMHLSACGGPRSSAPPLTAGQVGPHPAGCAKRWGCHTLGGHGGVKVRKPSPTLRSALGLQGQGEVPGLFSLYWLGNSLSHLLRAWRADDLHASKSGAIRSRAPWAQRRSAQEGQVPQLWPHL